METVRFAPPHSRRNTLVLGVVVVISLAAIGSILWLQAAADASRSAQTSLAQVRAIAGDLETAPDEAVSGRWAAARRTFTVDVKSIAVHLSRLLNDSPPAAMSRVQAAVQAAEEQVRSIDRRLEAHGNGHWTAQAAVHETATFADLLRLIDNAGASYAARASRASTAASAGSVAAILVLLGAFGTFYMRSSRARERSEALALENARLAELNHQRALTDPLTGVANRTLLVDRADQMLARARREHRSVAALYIDLDDFKHINDSLGHAVGDIVLSAVTGGHRN